MRVVQVKMSEERSADPDLARFSSLATATSIICTCLAAAIGVCLRFGAHLLQAKYPRLLSFLLVAQLVTLVGAAAAPAALWIHTVYRDITAAMLERTISRDLVAAAPGLAMVAASALQLFMISSFLLYRRELLAKEMAERKAKAERDATRLESHRLQHGAPKAAPATSSSMMV